MAERKQQHLDVDRRRCPPGRRWPRSGRAGFRRRRSRGYRGFRRDPARARARRTARRAIRAGTTRWSGCRRCGADNPARIEFDDESVGENAADGAGIDVVAFRGAAPAAQLVPVRVQLLTSRELHATLHGVEGTPVHKWDTPRDARRRTLGVAGAMPRDRGETPSGPPKLTISQRTRCAWRARLLMSDYQIAVGSAGLAPLRAAPSRFEPRRGTGCSPGKRLKSKPRRMRCSRIPLWRREER